MSNQVLQPTRALEVVPSDEVNIPFPNVVMNGTTTSGGSYLLIDNSGVDFVTQGIKVGDTVWNVIAGSFAVVTSVAATELELSENAFTSGGDDYVIYQGENTGCLLYVGVGGNLDLLTADNNIISMSGIADGSFIPIKTLRVYPKTTCTDIIALW